MRNILSAGQFDRGDIDRLIARAAGWDTYRDTRLSGKIMATLFYEPSTRTRLSFESAMCRLGGSVIGTEAAEQFSSAAKGETLQDTISVVSSYADVIVLRHREVGAAALAAEVATIPIINAGDGSGEHPTQALLDLLTIHKEIGRIDDFHVLFAGDLLYGRTVHSLVRLLLHCRNVRFTFAAVPELQIPVEIGELLTAHHVEYALSDSLIDVVADVDVLYQTRIQTERLTDKSKQLKAAADAFRITPAVMQKLPAHAILLHPLPRVGEIDPTVDADPRSAYFRQARNGVAMRMAILDEVLAGE